jgi:hypothetical protein
MQFNRLSAFTLGVIITAASVGAVSYANAAGNKTLKACANKSTGVMRYISRGSCKKTETSLSWSQMGIQGLPGVSGAKGDTGAAGTNGTNGTAGTNGQNFHVIDATGKDLGATIGVWNQGQTATIIFEGGLWEISSGTSFPNGAITRSSFYSDSSCRFPFAELPVNTPMARGWNNDSSAPKFWKASGESFLMSTRTVYAMVGSGTKPNVVFSCLPSDSAAFRTYFADEGDPRLSAVTEVTPPPYTAPFTIVAK